MESKDLFHFRLRFELKHSCNSFHLVLQGQGRKPVEAASLTAPCWCYPSPVQEPTNMRHFADLHNASLPTHSCVLPVKICWDSSMVEITRTVSCSCILEYKGAPTTVQRLYFNISKQKPHTLQNYILEK